MRSQRPFVRYFAWALIGLGGGSLAALTVGPVMPVTVTIQISVGAEPATTGHVAALTADPVNIAAAPVPPVEAEAVLPAASAPPAPLPVSAPAAPLPVVGDPTTIHLPTIAVDAPVIPLSLDGSGQLEAPQDFAAAGWYQEGPEPGEPGVAVVAGHVDSHTGPAVFYRLRDLRLGDPIVVSSATSQTEFRVTRTTRYEKDQFPTEQVYTSTGGSELRLITCGGEFDEATGSYRENIVVYASAVPST